MHGTGYGSFTASMCFVWLSGGNGAFFSRANGRRSPAELLAAAPGLDSGLLHEARLTLAVVHLSLT
eukprot:6466640-Lingulodinium_polyedra.AAC.1